MTTLLNEELKACRIDFAVHVLLAFGAAVIASGASADTKPGFYFGAGVGGSQVSVTNWDHNNNDNCCCCGDYHEETSDGDTAFSVHAGYRFMPYLAVEVGYVDSGNPEWNENQVYVPRLNDVFYNQVDFKKLDATEVSVAGLPAVSEYMGGVSAPRCGVLVGRYESVAGPQVRRRAVPQLVRRRRHRPPGRCRPGCEPDTALASPPRIPELHDRRRPGELQRRRQHRFAAVRSAVPTARVST